MRSGIVISVFLVLLASPAGAVPAMKSASVMAMKTEAERGNAEAQFLVGTQYRAGDGVDRDPAEAARWLRRAAEAGHAEAQNALGAMYVAGEGVESDAAAAEKWLRASAAQGDAEAQLNLGALFLAGGKPGEAVRWYEAAARNGSRTAMKELAEAYARGTGTERDPAEALKWYQQAAALGDVDARFVLGRMAVVHDRLAADLAGTRAAVKAEAEGGDVGSLLALGQAGASGQAAGEDPADAMHWRLLLAGLRGKDAWLVRGFLLENGIGVNPDPAAARAAYQQATEDGSPAAQYQLALMLLEGRGGDKDVRLAAVWLAMAAAQGHRAAAAQSDRLRDSLSAEDMDGVLKLWGEVIKRGEELSAAGREPADKTVPLPAKKTPP